MTTTSTAHVATPNGSRYLQQLCKHFGHKVPVEFSKIEGRVSLPYGECRLAADDTGLNMTVEGEGSTVDQLERILGDHLARFAFRENPTITWTSAA